MFILGLSEIGFGLGLFIIGIVHSFLFVVRCFNITYIHFGFLVIGFDWVCIGFVFMSGQRDKIFVIPCYNITYVHLDILEIGFVLHKK